MDLRAIKASAPAPKQKAPITIDLLARMLEITDNEPGALLWRAILSLAFFAGLRGSEYLPDCYAGHTPKIGRFSFPKTTKPILHYTVPRSKTMVHGFTIPLGCTGAPLCPYCAIINYLQARQSDGTLSRSAPLFLHSNGKHITKDQMNAKLRHLGSAIGLANANFSTHSLRAGAATTAAELGFKDWEIMKLGGWHSATYRSYIRKLDLHQARFPARLVAAAPALMSGRTATQLGLASPTSLHHHPWSPGVPLCCCTYHTSWASELTLTVLHPLICLHKCTLFVPVNFIPA